MPVSPGAAASHYSEGLAAEDELGRLTVGVDGGGLVRLVKSAEERLDHRRTAQQFVAAKPGNVSAASTDRRVAAWAASTAV